jgi:hypothetical protein
MTKEIIKLIIESPNGADMFSQWMLYKWTTFGVKVGLVVLMLAWLVYVAIKMRDN